MTGGILAGGKYSTYIYIWLVIRAASKIFLIYFTNVNLIVQHLIASQSCLTHWTHFTQITSGKHFPLGNRNNDWR